MPKFVSRLVTTMPLLAGPARPGGADLRLFHSSRDHGGPNPDRPPRVPGTPYPPLHLLTPHTPHPAPCTLHPAPYTLHPTLCTLHLTPYTLHPSPSTLPPAPTPPDHEHGGPDSTLPVFQGHYPPDPTALDLAGMGTETCPLAPAPCSQEPQDPLPREEGTPHKGFKAFTCQPRLAFSLDLRACAQIDLPELQTPSST